MTEPESPDPDSLTGPSHDGVPAWAGDLVQLVAEFGGYMAATTNVVNQLLAAQVALLDVVADHQRRLDEFAVATEPRDAAALAALAAIAGATRAEAEQARRHAASVMARTHGILARSHALVRNAEDARTDP